MRVVLVLALTACSFAAAEGPRPPPGPTACNLDNKPAITDAIVAVGAALAAGLTSVLHAPAGDVVAPIGIAGAFGVSSAYGFVQVSRCRTEHVKRPEWSLAEMPAVM